MADVSRRSLLRGFLALPVAARFAPVVAAELPLWPADGCFLVRTWDTVISREDMLAEYEASRHYFLSLYHAV